MFDFNLMNSAVQNLAHRIGSKLSDPLLTFKYFERFLASFCIVMPLILRLTDDNTAFRPSISNYVYMPHSYVFGMLLCIAAMLFIFNGAVYYKSERHMHISYHGQWYNVVLGVSLMGVICFPHLQYPIPHYFCAILFFVGNAVVTMLFYKDKHKAISITLGVLTLAAMPLVPLKIISLLAAEWISLTVIGIHFVLTTIDMDEQVNRKKPKVLV